MRISDWSSDVCSSDLPDISRGLVAEYAWLDPLKVAQSYGCEILALNWTLCTPERLIKAQRQGVHVSVWTVHEPALLRRRANFGVDNPITDFPPSEELSVGNAGDSPCIARWAPL